MARISGAIITNGVVSNICVIDEEEIANIESLTIVPATEGVAIGDLYDGENFIKPDAQLDFGEYQAEKIALIKDKEASIIRAGYEHSADEHVAFEDMTALNTMVTIATATLPWPEAYITGWITIENTRIPLPTAEDGIALYEAVTSYALSIKNTSRQYKDAVLAAISFSEVDAIDISVWPNT